MRPSVYSRLELNKLREKVFSAQILTDEEIDRLRGSQATSKDVDSVAFINEIIARSQRVKQATVSTEQNQKETQRLSALVSTLQAQLTQQSVKLSAQNQPALQLEKENQIKVIAQQLKDCEQQLAGEKAQSVSEANHLKVLQADYTRLELELNTARVEQESYLRQVQTLRQTATDLTNQHQAQVVSLQSRIAEATLLHNQAVSARTSCEQTQKNTVGLLESCQEHSRSSHEKYETQLAQLRVNLQQVTSAANEAERVLGTTVAEQKARITALEASSALQNSAEQEVRSQISEQQADFERQIKGYQGQLQECRLESTKNNERVLQELTQCSEKYDECSQKNQHLQSQLTSLTSELADKTAELNRKQESLTQNQKTLEDVRLKLRESERNGDSLTKKHAEKTQSLQDCLQESEMKESRVTTLLQQLVALQGNVADQQESNTVCQKRVAEQAAHVDSLTAHNATLTTKLKDLQSDMDDLTRQLEANVQKLQSCRGEVAQKDTREESSMEREQKLIDELKLSEKNLHACDRIRQEEHGKYREYVALLDECNSKHKEELLSGINSFGSVIDRLQRIQKSEQLLIDPDGHSWQSTFVVDAPSPHQIPSPPGPPMSFEALSGSDLTHLNDLATEIWRDVYDAYGVNDDDTVQLRHIYKASRMASVYEPIEVLLFPPSEEDPTNSLPKFHLPEHGFLESLTIQPLPLILYENNVYVLEDHKEEENEYFYQKVRECLWKFYDIDTDLSASAQDRAFLFPLRDPFTRYISHVKLYVPGFKNANPILSKFSQLWQLVEDVYIPVALQDILKHRVTARVLAGYGPYLNQEIIDPIPVTNYLKVLTVQGLQLSFQLGEQSQVTLDDGAVISYNSRTKTTLVDDRGVGFYLNRSVYIGSQLRPSLVHAMIKFGFAFPEMKKAALSLVAITLAPISPTDGVEQTYYNALVQIHETFKLKTNS